MLNRDNHAWLTSYNPQLGASLYTLSWWLDDFCRVVKRVVVFIQDMESDGCRGNQAGVSCAISNKRVYEIRRMLGEFYEAGFVELS